MQTVGIPNASSVCDAQKSVCDGIGWGEAGRPRLTLSPHLPL